MQWGSYTPNWLVIMFPYHDCLNGLEEGHSAAHLGLYGISVYDLNCSIASYYPDTICLAQYNLILMNFRIANEKSDF